MLRLPRRASAVLLITGLWTVALVTPTSALNGPPENDNFADAATITSLSFEAWADLSEATAEVGEPHGSCSSGAAHTVWYRYVATDDTMLSSHASAFGPAYWAMWRGTSLVALEELGCGNSGVVVRAPVTAGETYYFQLGPGWPGLYDAYLEVHEVPLEPQFQMYPNPATTDDVVTFHDTTTDATEFGVVEWLWDFGDGTTGSGPSVTHQYAANGSYAVTLTLVTTSGRRSSAERFATIEDDSRPPVIYTPGYLRVYAESSAGAVVTYDVDAWDDRDGSVPVACEPASGFEFPVGWTVVTCLAADAAGNVADTWFWVEVLIDTTPPWLWVPGWLTVDAESPAGAEVTYWISAWDDRDGSVTPKCDRASGEVYSIGLTVVSCSASDASGNASQASFTVEVRGAAAQLTSLQELMDWYPQAGSSLSDKLATVQRHIDRGRLSQAADELGAFISSVNAQVGGPLEAWQAAELTQRAERIIRVLGG